MTETLEKEQIKKITLGKTNVVDMLPAMDTDEKNYANNANKKITKLN